MADPRLRKPSFVSAATAALSFRLALMDHTRFEQALAGNGPLRFFNCDPKVRALSVSLGNEMRSIPWIKK